MGLHDLMKQAKNLIPEKLFREIETAQKQNQKEEKEKKKRPVYGEVKKGLKTGIAESGTHLHALIRNELRTLVDGRHRHMFVVRDIRGELVQLITELDGEHWHTLDEAKSMRTDASVSTHQHVVRIPREIQLDNGETLHPGTAFITRRDGAHEHGADMLETTNFDGAHPHTLELPGEMTTQSINISEFWDIFGPLDMSEITPIFSTEQIHDRLRSPRDFPIMKSYSGFLKSETNYSPADRILVALWGQQVKEVETTEEEMVFKQEEVQEVILSKRRFENLEQAEDKLDDLEYKRVRIEDHTNVFRAEIRRPSEFKRESLRELRLENGVTVVIGILVDQFVIKATEIQTLIFPQDKFDKKQALAFAKRNDFKSNKIDVTSSSVRLRQRDPGDFVRLRTIALPGSDGVKAVIGPVKKEIEEHEFARIAEVCPDTVPICKQDDEKRIVTGIVLEPDVFDLQGDTITADEIEKSAAFFLQKSRTIGFRHKRKTKSVLVGSMVMPASFTIDGPNGKQKVKKGTWLISVHVPDEKLWADIKKKNINAFSVGGFGSREVIGKEHISLEGDFGDLNWVKLNEGG